MLKKTAEKNTRAKPYWWCSTTFKMLKNWCHKVVLIQKYVTKHWNRKWSKIKFTYILQEENLEIRLDQRTLAEKATVVQIMVQILVKKHSDWKKKQQVYLNNTSSFKNHTFLLNYKKTLNLRRCLIILNDETKKLFKKSNQIQAWYLSKTTFIID
jgi:hypothetical protein